MAENQGGNAGPGKLPDSESGGESGGSDSSGSDSSGGEFSGGEFSGGSRGFKASPGDSGLGLTQGFEIAAGIGLGVVVGMWWDRHYHSSPWGLLVGLLLGCIGGTYLLIKEAMRSNKD